MKHIIDKNNFYIGFAGSKTELINGQKEVPFAPSKEFVKAKWNGTLYVEGATEEEIIAVRVVPNEVALWKIRTVLSIMGLTNQIETILNDLVEPQRTGALAIWNHGNTVERYSNTVLYLQSQLSMTDTELDNVFVEAEKISL